MEVQSISTSLSCVLEMIKGGAPNELLLERLHYNKKEYSFFSLPQKVFFKNSLKKCISISFKRKSLIDGEIVEGVEIVLGDDKDNTQNVLTCMFIDSISLSCKAPMKDAESISLYTYNDFTATIPSLAFVQTPDILETDCFFIHYEYLTEDFFQHLQTLSVDAFTFTWNGLPFKSIRKSDVGHFINQIVEMYSEAIEGYRRIIIEHKESFDRNLEHAQQIVRDQDQEDMHAWIQQNRISRFSGDALNI